MGDSTGPIRRRVTVTGRVQGVFFRDSCRSTAIDLGVAGTVRNRSDGAVEIDAQGPASAVERLIAWSRTGPPRAEVVHVEVSEEPPRAVHGFEVVG
ncbi:acylphosphatase [Ilumatobacter sp.]|uniref:acylphosphatase n=1 Tax=Ilumatobacter sp. TaxID=1967498 RepID=UPI003B519007